MKKRDFEVPGDLIKEFTTRAVVLADMYRELSDPKTAGAVIGGLLVGDREIHRGFLERLKPDRWPLGRLDLCIRIGEYVRREISRPPRDVAVWVLKSPLTLDEMLEIFRINWRSRQRGEDTSTRQAPVFEGMNGALPLGTRTIVPDGPYQDALKAAGLLVPAFERVQEEFEIWWPTGGVINLCLPG